MAKNQRSGSSVVKIAIGVVLGLLVIKACDRYEAIKLAKAGIAKLFDLAPEPGPAQTHAQRERELEPRKSVHEPLQADERCVDGQRFRHVNDGWVNNGSC